MVIKSRRMICARHVAHIGQMKIAYTILVRKPEGKTLLRIPKHRKNNNIRMYLTEIWWKVVDLSGSG
jgi:hypothetical protein